MDAPVPPEAGDAFKFLGTSKGPDGQVVYTYEHRLTRRRIHVDENGNTYSMTPTMGVPIFTPITTAGSP